VKNYADLGECFQPWWTTILHGLHNSSDATQPHSIIAKISREFEGALPPWYYTILIFYPLKLKIGLAYIPQASTV